MCQGDVIDVGYGCILSSHSISTFNKYYYEKGDYNNMRKFATTEFAKKTNTATTVNDMWNHFMDILKACRDKFIPHKVIKKGGGIKQHMPYE